MHSADSQGKDFFEDSEETLTARHNFATASLQRRYSVATTSLQRRYNTGAVVFFTVRSTSIEFDRITPGRRVSTSA